MTLYTNNRPVSHKFFSNDSFFFFKIYTKQEYFKYLNSQAISYHSYTNGIDFPYNVKQINGVDSKDYYLIETYPDFVYDSKRKTDFFGFEVRKYLVEESYLKHGNKGLVLQSRMHFVIELLIGTQLFACFEKDLKLLK